LWLHAISLVVGTRPVLQIEVGYKMQASLLGKPPDCFSSFDTLIPSWPFRDTHFPSINFSKFWLNLSEGFENDCHVLWESPTLFGLDYGYEHGRLFPCPILKQVWTPYLLSLDSCAGHIIGWTCGSLFRYIM
jgi:hypothetical protein